MLSSRRVFLGFSAAWMAVLAAGRSTNAAAQAQRDGTASSPDLPSRDPLKDLGTADAKFNPRQILEANEKSIKKDVERLSEIVQQLQKQIEDKDTKDVLSLDVLRQTDEIERLAKHIRSLVRG